MHSSILIILAICMVSVMGFNNCPYCATVSECLRECTPHDPVVSVSFFGGWSQCKTICSGRGKCAIRRGRSCWCSNSCNNDSRDDITPYDDIPWEEAEAYIYGVVSTLGLIFIGMVVFCMCNRQKNRRSETVKYAKVINEDTTDDERVVINK